jgi:hypothetical protein
VWPEVHTRKSTSRFGTGRLSYVVYCRARFVRAVTVFAAVIHLQFRQRQDFLGK